MTTPRQRAANTAWARKKRLKQWAALAAALTRCPAMLGRKLPCRERLTSRLVDGHTVPFCARCECKRRGVCVDCRREPVAGSVGRGVRCGGCRKLASCASQDRYRAKHPRRALAQWKRRKAREAADPTLKARTLEAKRLWRLARADHVRRQKAKWQRGNVKVRAYMRTYRATHPERRHPHGHPCASCGTALTGRPKKCDACRTRDRNHARSILFRSVA